MSNIFVGVYIHSSKYSHVKSFVYSWTKLGQTRGLLGRCFGRLQGPARLLVTVREGECQDPGTKRDPERQVSSTKPVVFRVHVGLFQGVINYNLFDLFPGSSG